MKLIYADIILPDKILGYFCPPYYYPTNLGIIRLNFQKLKTPSKPQFFKTFISIGLLLGSPLIGLLFFG
jgi:hypothetical protein